MELKNKHGNMILGAVSIVVGIVILVLTRMQGLGFLRNGMPGPGMFPTLCAIAVVVCGGLLIMEVTTAEAKAKKKGEADAEAEENLINVGELHNLLAFLILGLMILFLSEYIGLLTCLFLSIVLYIKVQGKDSWVKAIVLGLGASVFLYLVFVTFLSVPLPKGPFGF